MEYIVTVVTDARKQQERACPVCGKRFSPAIEHAWTIGKRTGKVKKYVCSYTCMRAWERGELVKKK